MDKKTALLTLLENSFWIDDPTKLKVIDQIDTLTEEQIDELGKFLVAERDYMIEHEDEVLAKSQKILEIISQAVVDNQTTDQVQ